jgi:phosphatidylserine decarboxylase
VAANWRLAGLTTFERLNFLLTNRIPRRWTTLFMGWFSRIENPVVSRLSIAIWKLFADDLELHGASKTEFRSLHDCFTRELKNDARTIDQDLSVVVSPCDGIVGAFGRVARSSVDPGQGLPLLPRRPGLQRVAGESLYEADTLCGQR